MDNRSSDAHFGCPYDAGANVTAEMADVMSVAGTLVQLEAWCRMRGLPELATLLEPALDWTDKTLTGA